MRVAVWQAKRIAVLDEREKGDLDARRHVDVGSRGGWEQKGGGRTGTSRGRAQMTLNHSAHEPLADGSAGGPVGEFRG